MPKILGYGNDFLGDGSIGRQLFKPAPMNANDGNGLYPNPKKSTKPGARRTIARRGSEYFIAVGKEIRWADLASLKEDAVDKAAEAKRADEATRDFSDAANGLSQNPGYRTIKTQVADDIKQLVVSPNSNYIAILTTHTVHIALLPDPTLLNTKDTSVLKMKTYTLGPTTHVTSQAAIASALWHPLGVNGTCLVTVTEDAIVRIWELSTTDRWSFDKPTLSIDMHKLADGSSLDQDFGATISGTNKGYTPDAVEMEVASACFAGRGSGGWSSMTLWVAMREGDVYALCPLLPEKWSPPATLIPSLSVSIVANIAVMEDDPEVSSTRKLLAQQQLAWMTEIDSQEPMHVESPAGDVPVEVYSRPSKPGRVPKLQGPFDIDIPPIRESLDYDDLSDIFAIGAKIDTSELMFGEEEDIEDDCNQEGLSVGVVCFVTSSGRLTICLDLDGVEARWLPKSKSKSSRLMAEPEESSSLLTFEVLDLLRDTETSKENAMQNWPVFSTDPMSRYSFFVTDTSSISFLSLGSWVFRLEDELANVSEGNDLRLDLLSRGSNTIRERVFTQATQDHSTPLSAAEVCRDPSLGYFLLSATPFMPVSINFETASEPEAIINLRRSMTRSPSYDPEPSRPMTLCLPRPTYEPPHFLEETSTIPAFLEQIGRSKYSRLLNEEVRLSPATLQIMTEAHKVISEETHRVSTAAAELFRRCEKLQIDLQDHIKKAVMVADRVRHVTEEETSSGSVEHINESIERRVKAAEEKNRELSARHEELRKKVKKGTVGRDLSDKEKQWIEEMNTYGDNILGRQGDEEMNEQNVKKPWVRYEEIQVLKDELLDQVNNAMREDTPRSDKVKVPSELRKSKLTQVMSMLERETILVEGAKEKMERLTMYGAEV